MSKPCIHCNGSGIEPESRKEKCGTCKNFAPINSKDDIFIPGYEHEGVCELECSEYYDCILDDTTEGCIYHEVNN